MLSQFGVGVVSLYFEVALSSATFLVPAHPTTLSPSLYPSIINALCHFTSSAFVVHSFTFPFALACALSSLISMDKKHLEQNSLYYKNYGAVSHVRHTGRAGKWDCTLIYKREYALYFVFNSELGLQHAISHRRMRFEKRGDILRQHLVRQRLARQNAVQLAARFGVARTNSRVVSARKVVLVEHAGDLSLRRAAPPPQQVSCHAADRRQ